MNTHTPYPTLQRFVAAGGTIDIGRIDVLERAAVASDARAVWVVLSGQPGELLNDLMLRLDTTLAYCLANDRQVDEYSVPAPPTGPADAVELGSRCA